MLECWCYNVLVHSLHQHWKGTQIQTQSCSQPERPYHWIEFWECIRLKFKQVYCTYKQFLIYISFSSNMIEFFQSSSFILLLYLYNTKHTYNFGSLCDLLCCCCWDWEEKKRHRIGIKECFFLKRNKNKTKQRQRKRNLISSCSSAQQSQATSELTNEINQMQTTK